MASPALSGASPVLLDRCLAVYLFRRLDGDGVVSFVPFSCVMLSSCIATRSLTIPFRGIVFTVYINLPFDGLAIIVLFFALKIDIEREPILQGLRTLDWTGFAFIIGGTISFLYGLELGATNAHPWSAPVVICTMVIGGLLLAAFMVWEARFASKPIIPGRIFSKSTNMAAFVLSCLHSFVFISYDFFLPLYSQVILGLSPLLSGVTLFALIVPLSCMPMVGALVIRKTGNYVYICYLGAALMALGNGLFISFETERDWAKIIIFQIITGLGAGLLFQSPMIALQSFLRQSDIAAAMSAYNFLRNLCTSISVVIGSVLIQHSLPGGSSLTSLHTTHDTKSGGEVEESVSKQQYLTGLRNMWTFYTAMCGLMLVSAFFIKQKRPEQKTEETANDPKASDQDDHEDKSVTVEKETV